MKEYRTDAAFDAENRQEDELQIRDILTVVADTIRETGADPVTALAGYLLSEDPSYIPVQNGARRLMSHLDRDIVLELLIRSYLSED